MRWEGELMGNNMTVKMTEERVEVRNDDNSVVLREHIVVVVVSNINCVERLWCFETSQALYISATVSWKTCLVSF